MSGSAPRVLVVDDEPALRNAIAFDLKRKGFDVLTAAGGREALRVLASSQVDIVLSDVRMPDGDGVELLAGLREMSPVRPAIMLITGFSELGLEEAYDQGANAVISKPFDRKALIAAVQQAAAPRESAWNGLPSSPEFARAGMPLYFRESAFGAAAGQVSLGHGGMFVAFEGRTPKAGETADFGIPAGANGVPRLLGHGRVRWVREAASGSLPRGCGIEFESLDAACRDEVIQAILRSGTKSFIPRS